MSTVFDNAVFRNLYCNLAGNTDGQCAAGGIFGNGLLPAGFEWLAFLVAGFVLVFVIVNAVLMGVLFFIWAERRLLGRFQQRTGPNRWGPFGLFTPVADAIKTMFKEDIVPDVADRLLFNLAPVVMVVPIFLIFALIPFGAGVFLADINVGILFIIAITGLNVLAIVTAAWASGNRYAMFSGMRAVAMLISYEIPMVIALVGVIMLTGSLSLVSIVNAQAIPFIIVQPLAFFVFLLASIAEINRTPFDVAEAESEIVAGYMTDYSSMKFGLFYLAEFAAAIAASAVVATVFLGGWRGFGPIPGEIWFFAKMGLVLFVIVWIRATWPRLRADQIMAFAWKALFELTLINLVVTGILVMIWPNPTVGQLWMMAGINWIVFIVSVIAFGQILGPKHNQYAAGNVQNGVTLAGEPASRPVAVTREPATPVSSGAERGGS